MDGTAGGSGPDQSYDEEGCFSGSGIETEEGHLLAYTGVMEKEWNGEKVTYQNQCLALGDGRTYVKMGANPVVTGDMLPEAFSREHFRDPKIWREDDGYYMAVGNKTKDGIPQVVLFHSEDMAKWQYVSVLAKDRERTLGGMWECPDFSAWMENMCCSHPLRTCALAGSFIMETIPCILQGYMTGNGMSFITSMCMRWMMVWIFMRRRRCWHRTEGVL